MTKDGANLHVLPVMLTFVAALDLIELTRGFTSSWMIFQPIATLGNNPHPFRHFRFGVLRKAGVPDDLIKLWLGHSQNLMDLYAAQFRREWCEKAGLGFELGELGYKSEAPIRPALVA